MYLIIQFIISLSSVLTTPDATIQLALTLLPWRIWWAPNNASRWQMGFNLAFNGLMLRCHDGSPSPFDTSDIQGVTGGTDQTSGECSLGHTIPI